MRKIPCAFARVGEPYLAINEVTPGCEWVAAGEGSATRKLDGTCCMVRSGRLYRRATLRPGTPDPEGFELVEERGDGGRRIGWVEVVDHGGVAFGDRGEEKYHREVLPLARSLPDGTYELVGPKVQGNAERLTSHSLERHGGVLLEEVPRDFASLRRYLDLHRVDGRPIEGVVFHHPDGRMAKIRRKDFGLEWPVRSEER